MVLGDMVIFGAYFLIYMVHRAMAPEAFLAAQQHLNVTIGVINTMVLLTSSLVRGPRCVTRPVAGRPEQAIRLHLRRGRLWSVVHRDQGVRVVDSRSLHGYTVPTSSSRSTTCSPECTCFHVTLGLLILGVCVRELRVPGAAQDIPRGAGCDVLAHGRSALDRDLRSALRDEVNR